MIKQLLKYGFLLGIVIVVAVFSLDFYIQKITKKNSYTTIDQAPKSYTGLVLGARVYQNGDLSGILQDRVDVALELYDAKKITRFLLSGDHGQKKYDEVNQMKKYLIQKGVPEVDIFLDHAGFDTYNSIYRAKNIFLADDITIVTQGFHLRRALFIAQSLGLNAKGVIADRHRYGIAKQMYVREKIANLKAFFEIVFHKKPTFLGDEIPITGDSKKSYD